MMKSSSHAFMLQLFNEAVRACLPENCLPDFLQNIDASNGVFVLGAGKAAADMAATTNAFFQDACSGAVVTRYGYQARSPTGKIEVLLAAHPIPDKNSFDAGKRLLELAAKAPQEATVLFLISGGGSALISVPADGISFEAKLAIHRFLLRSGASIDEMNVVRKQLSKIKGGRLAGAVRRAATTLAISDVVGDDPCLIASGPTVADDSTAQQALAILDKYQWPIIPTVQACLHAQFNLAKPKVVGGSYHIVASARTALDAAMAMAKAAGWETEVISYEQQGEAAEVARIHAEIALSYRREGRRVALFSAGELTVTLGPDAGQGGPNQEYALSLALALDGSSRICALACDTDGVDGSQDVAGAYIDPQTLVKAREASLDPLSHLHKHDTYSFFKAIGDLVVTGPTGTNVNDFRVILVD